MTPQQQACIADAAVEAHDRAADLRVIEQRSTGIAPAREARARLARAQTALDAAIEQAVER